MNYSTAERSGLKQRYIYYGIAWVLVFLVIVLAPAISHAQEQNQTSAVTVTLSTEKDDFKFGDPVVIDCTVNNLHFKGRPNFWPYITFDVEHNGKPIPAGERDISCQSVSGLHRAIPESGSRTTRIRLNRWAKLTEPGTYKLTAILHSGDKTTDDDEQIIELQFKSKPVTIALKPRSKKEMASYIAGLKEKLYQYDELAKKCREGKASMPEREAEIAARSTKAMSPFIYNDSGVTWGPSDAYIQQLMFTYDPSLIPTFVDLLYTHGAGNNLWVKDGLMNYFHNDDTWSALIKAATTRGLAPNMESIICDWSRTSIYSPKTDPLTPKEWKQIIELSLAPDNKVCWSEGCVAARLHPDDAFIERLIAIATDPKGPARDLAMRALAFNRTDRSISTLQQLLKDSNKLTAQLAKQAISEGSFHPAVAQKHSAPPVPPENLIVGKLQAPSHYKLSLNFDKPEYFLGENAIMHFCVQNTGDKPIAIDYGSDYRFAPRALRFKVKAVDEKA